MPEPFSCNHGGSGEPEPIDRSDGTSTLFEVGTIVAVACGGFLLLSYLAGFTTVTVRGATRSGRLKWQERQAEIEQVIQNSTLPPTDSSSVPPKERQ
jgi:hypothetical protein